MRWWWFTGKTVTPGPTWTNTLISTDSLARPLCALSPRFGFSAPVWSTVTRRPPVTVGAILLQEAVIGATSTSTDQTHVHPCICAKWHTNSTDTGAWMHIQKANTEKHTHTHTLSRLYLFSVNQISARVGRLAQSRGRSVLGAHCREPCCQPTAPTPMTLLLCTIHQTARSCCDWLSHWR